MFGNFTEEARKVLVMAKKEMTSLKHPYVGSEHLLLAILKKDKTMINEMVDQCGVYSASMLVEITHNQDPWLHAYERHCNNVIEKKAIKQYFEKG